MNIYPGILLIEERHFIYRLIKLQIQSITEAPVEVLRAGFRKDVKLMSIIPGKLKGQPHQLSFKFIRSANRLPMHPSSTLRPVVEHRGVEPLTSTMRMSRATNCANAPYSIYFALPHPQWSRLSTGELAPFRMRNHPMKFPPLAVISCFPNCANAPCASGSITQRGEKSKGNNTISAWQKTIRIDILIL